MKKTLIIVAALVLCVTALTGCGKNETAFSSKSESTEVSGAANIVLSGKYVGTDLDVIGAKLSAPENTYIEFREDGTLTFTILGESIDGTYSGSGNEIIIQLESGEESGTRTATLDGNKITVGDDGGTMIFEKE